MLSSGAERLQARGAGAEAGILEAQALMVEDPALLEGALALIGEGIPADRAVTDALEPFGAMLRASSDPVFQARAADVDDVAEQIRRVLYGRDAAPPSPERASILVARDLAPSETAGLDRDLGEPRGRLTHVAGLRCSRRAVPRPGWRSHVAGRDQ